MHTSWLLPTIHGSLSSCGNGYFASFGSFQIEKSLRGEGKRESSWVSGQQVLPGCSYRGNLVQCWRVCCQKEQSLPHCMLLPICSCTALALALLFLLSYSRLYQDLAKNKGKKTFFLAPSSSVFYKLKSCIWAKPTTTKQMGSMRPGLCRSSPHKNTPSLNATSLIQQHTMNISSPINDTQIWDEQALRALAWSRDVFSF